MDNHTEEEIANLRNKFHDLEEEFYVLKKKNELEMDEVKCLKIERNIEENEKQRAFIIQQIEELENSHRYKLLYPYTKSLAYKEQRKLLAKIEKAALLLIDGHGKKHHEWFYEHILPSCFPPSTKQLKPQILRRINTSKLLLDSVSFSEVANSFFSDNIFEDESDNKILEDTITEIIKTLESKTIILPIRINSDPLMCNESVMKKLVTHFFIPICEAISSRADINNHFIVLLIGKGVVENKYAETIPECIRTMTLNPHIYYEPIKEMTFEKLETWVEYASIIDGNGVFKVQKEKFTPFLTKYEQELSSYIPPCSTVEGTLEKIFNDIGLKFENILNKTINLD